MDPNDPGYAGYREYTPTFLRIYDAWVLGVMAPFAWKTGAEPGLELYRQHTGARHLDAGPGTGYFIERAGVPLDTELTLLDANPNVLAHCAKRLVRWEPTLVEANLLKPLPVQGPFDSAALAHVIHCLPGAMEAKAAAVEHVADVLTDDGVLFGGTVLGMGANHNAAARGFLRIANRQGGFDNLGDDAEGLRAILEHSFHDVDIDDAASIAYFVARHPRR